MSKITLYFKDYSAYHQHPQNQAYHFIGIPTIMLTLLGILSVFELGVPGLNLGLVLWLGTAIWYMTLDWKMGLPFSVITLGCYALGNSLMQYSPGITIAVFALGWIFQGIGHYVYEKKSPAFYNNIKHLLIGPFWIFAKLSRQSARFHEK